jgi:CubicO group peptidase (beta-lactamase class C family)
MNDKVSVTSRICLLFGVVSTVLFCTAQDKSAGVASIFAALRSEQSPGAAVVVVREGKVVFERGYGIRDLRTKGPINSHTNFRLASVSKQFTAMAIMLLVHDGKLHYGDRLSDVLSGFPAYGKQITIGNLLNHTSGLLDYEDLMAKQYGNTPDDQIPQIHDAGVLALLEKAKTTKFPPGTRWDYSNSGYCVLAMVVEQISGKPFAQFVHERIFAPLKMDHTLAYEKDKGEIPDRAYGYSRVGGVWKETDQSSTSATLGDGGIYSSLEDLVRWDAALRDHQLLSEEEMRPAITPAKVTDTRGRTPEGLPTQYGFGWFLEPYKGHRRMWHYGETVGFRTSIQRFPDDGLTVIVLCNRTDLSAMDLAKKVADLYLSPATK